MFCPKCGNQLVEGKPFCTKCGAQVSAAPQVSTPVAGPASSAGFVENIKEFIESFGSAKLLYIGTVLLSTLSFLFMFFPVYGNENSGMSVSFDMFLGWGGLIPEPMVALIIIGILLMLSAIAAVVLPAFMKNLRAIPFLYLAPAAIDTVAFFYLIIRLIVLSADIRLAFLGGIALMYPGWIFMLVLLGTSACSFFLFWKQMKKPAQF